MDYEPQFLSVEDFNEMLQQWSGKPIKITKHELEDIDQIQMQLENISYKTNTRRIDDYVPMHILQLNGKGNIEAAEELHPLPNHLYEIPLEDTSLYEYDGSQFILSTDRGVYKLEKD